MNSTLALDDEATWPPWLLQAVGQAMPLLRSYENRRRERETEATSWTDRWRQPPNEFAEARKQFLKKIANQLRGFSVLGYHCTRLLTEEIETIRQTGFRLLSEALVFEKLESAVRLGQLSAEVVSLLRDNHLAHERGPGIRLRMIHFTFSRDGLRDEGGLYRFFKFWGGEAIYAGVETTHPAAAAALQTLGEPVVVVCAVPLQHLSLDLEDIAEVLVGGYLRPRDGRAEKGPDDVEGHVNVDLDPSCVVAFLRGNELEAATGLSAWDG